MKDKKNYKKKDIRNKLKNCKKKQVIYHLVILLEWIGWYMQNHSNKSNKQQRNFYLVKKSETTMNLNFKQLKKKTIQMINVKTSL